MLLEDSIQYKKKTWKNNVVRDHLGNTYRTKSEMCNHYGVMIGTYNSRINRGWSVEKALTGKESTNNE